MGSGKDVDKGSIDDWRACGRVADNDAHLDAAAFEGNTLLNDDR